MTDRSRPRSSPAPTRSSSKMVTSRRTPLVGTLRPDYVVVGAGAAGCVIAGRLSQMLPDARIALIGPAANGSG